MPNENELAIPAAAELDMSAFGDYAGAGLEEIKSSDLIIPRLAILQSTSPAVQDEDAENRAGDLFNMTTNENYGRRIQFVALAYWLSRTKWETPDITAPVECISADGLVGSKFGKCSECKFNQWTQDEKGAGIPPLCTEFKNVLLIPKVGDGSVTSSPFMIYSAKRSAIRSMNRFLTAIKTLKVGEVTPPIFATVWELKSEQQKNSAKGAIYYTPSFSRVGFVTKDMIPGLISRFEEYRKLREDMMNVVAQQNSTIGDDEQNLPADHEGGEGLSDEELENDNVGY